MSKSLLRRWSLWITLGLALLGGILGGLGWNLELARTTTLAPGSDDFWLELMFRTLLLYFGESSYHSGFGLIEDNIPLQLGRILAPMATLSAVLQLVTGKFLAWYVPFRISRRRNNILICGLGDYGHGFARNLLETARESKRRLVVIEKNPSPEAESFCTRQRIDLICGDTRDTRVLETAGIARASLLVVVAGDDNTNIETAMAARQCLDSAGDRPEPLTAYVSLRDPGLWRQFMAARSLSRQTARFVFEPVNLAAVAARKLLWDVPLPHFAELRGQDAVHLVMIGFDGFAEAIIVQFLKTSPYKAQGKPVVTILTADPEAARGRLLRDYPEIEEVCGALSIRAFDPRSSQLNESLMDEIESQAPVSAVIVCQPSDHLTLGTGMYVQDSMRRHAFWRAPVFLRMAICKGVGGMLQDCAQACRFDEVMESFGTENELCDIRLIDARIDRIARSLHEGYRAARKLQQDYAHMKDESLNDWTELAETYREANRRAADHLKAKLMSRGCAPLRSEYFRAPQGFSLCQDGHWTDRLAALEHDSWAKDRRLDGWRPGAPRDNARRIHPNLRHDYEELSEQHKEYDRQQIRQLNNHFIEHLKSGDPRINLRLDYWVGLVGANFLSPDEARDIDRFMAERVMPHIGTSAPDASLTFVTPLAPGSDYILTSAAMRYCRDNSVPHRLILVEGVPDSHMIDDYRVAYERGGAWSADRREDGKNWDRNPDGDGDGARQRIVEARRDMMPRDTMGWVIDLTDRYADFSCETARQKGYEAAGRYIADRAHLLVAACRRDAAVLTGGTRALLDYRESPDCGLSDWPESFRREECVHWLKKAGAANAPA